MFTLCQFHENTLSPWPTFCSCPSLMDFLALFGPCDCIWGVEVLSVHCGLILGTVDQYEPGSSRGKSGLVLVTIRWGAAVKTKPERKGMADGHCPGFLSLCSPQLPFSYIPGPSAWVWPSPQWATPSHINEQSKKMPHRLPASQSQGAGCRESFFSGSSHLPHGSNSIQSAQQLTTRIWL